MSGPSSHRGVCGRCNRRAPVDAVGRGGDACAPRQLQTTAFLRLGPLQLTSSSSHFTYIRAIISGFPTWAMRRDVRILLVGDGACQLIADVSHVAQFAHRRRREEHHSHLAHQGVLRSARTCFP